MPGAAFGIVGMETAFPVLYTHLVTKGKLTLQELIKLMHTNPRKRFGLPLNRHGLKEELEKEKPSFAVWDLGTFLGDRSRQKFQSKGRSCPFEDWNVRGRCLLTVVDGRTIWNAANVGKENR